MSETTTQKFDWETFGKGVGILVVVVLVLAIVGGIIFRLLAVTFVDNYELGYTYDLRTGKIEQLDRTGYIVQWPIIVNVHTVDLRPMQVCINANNRVLNCKLVQFNPVGLKTFISWHGRNNYSGGSQKTGGFNDILKSYAYDGSGKTYPFLTIIRELKPDEVQR